MRHQLFILSFAICIHLIHQVLWKSSVYLGLRMWWGTHCSAGVQGSCRVILWPLWPAVSLGWKSALPLVSFTHPDLHVRYFQCTYCFIKNMWICCCRCFSSSEEVLGSTSSSEEVLSPRKTQLVLQRTLERKKTSDWSYQGCLWWKCLWHAEIIDWESQKYHPLFLTVKFQRGYLDENFCAKCYLCIHCN